MNNVKWVDEEVGVGVGQQYRAFVPGVLTVRAVNVQMPHTYRVLQCTVSQGQKQCGQVVAPFSASEEQARAKTESTPLPPVGWGQSSWWHELQRLENGVWVLVMQHPWIVPGMPLDLRFAVTKGPKPTGMEPIVARSSRVQWLGEVATLGVPKNPEACQTLMQLQNQRNELVKQREELDAQIANAEAAQATDDVKQYLQSVRASITAEINARDGAIAQIPKDACQDVPEGGGGGGVECDATKPCPADKDCVAGKCVDKCPSGQVRDATTGTCIAAPAVKKKGAPWGLFALAAAAAGGIFLAVRAPKLPPREAERGPADNPRRGPKRRYAVLACTPEGLLAQGGFVSPRSAHQVAREQGVPDYQVRAFNTRACPAPVQGARITPAPVIAVGPEDNPRRAYYSVVTCGPKGFLVRGRFKSSRIAHQVARQAGLTSYEVRRFDVRDCVGPVQDNPCGCAENLFPKACEAAACNNPAAWYVFTYERGGRMPKEYDGPFSRREDAVRVANIQKARYPGASDRYEVKQLSEEQFAKIWPMEA